MTLADSFNQLAEAIRNLDPRANPSVRIQNPTVGLKVGTCINCGESVALRQPWLTKHPIVNDGWYVLHCENEECHNYYGMELKENEFDLADFVSWNEAYLLRNPEEEVFSSNVIPFRKIGGNNA